MASKTQKKPADYKERLEGCVASVCRVSSELGVNPLDLSREKWIEKRLSTDPTKHGMMVVGGFDFVRNAAAKKLGVKPVTAELSVSLVENHRRDLQVNQLKKVNTELVRKLRDYEDTLEVITQLKEQAFEPSPVVRREKASGLREATAVLMCSDWHVEESVFPEQINGRNEYTPEIATSRARNLIQGLIWHLDLYKGKIAIRDLILWLGGDMISGFIHEELQETNSMSPIEAAMFCQELIATDLIEPLLASTKLERIIIPCNYGNHGRVKKQKQHKNAAKNSYEWMLYHSLKQRFSHEKRVEFHIANGAHLYLNVYGLKVRFTHGDDMSYGGGVGGLSVPVTKALYSWNSFQHADLTCFGHFHQYMSLSNFVCNGSLIGYNEYALSIKAKYEPPQQAFFLIDAERGKRHSTPIWVDDESFEGSLRTSYEDAA